MSKAIDKKASYNLIAALAIVGAVVVAVTGADQKISEGLVLLAGVIVGRG